MSPGAPLSSVQAWRLLRMPFALPERCRHAHTCEWERIDVDKSGCRLCSHVHVCGYGVCTAVVETTDALVCEITGLCVRPSNISTSGFSDEVISYGCKQAYSGDAARQDMYAARETPACVGPSLARAPRHARALRARRATSMRAAPRARPPRAPRDEHARRATSAPSAHAAALTCAAPRARPPRMPQP